MIAVIDLMDKVDIIKSEEKYKMDTNKNVQLLGKTPR